ncbi:MAG: hypothetical protein GIKADHBN_00245 [Phycisphaerales bacterium]|nr:hypothetical protein [Phycisphaerales bacterium]
MGAQPTFRVIEAPHLSGRGDFHELAVSRDGSRFAYTARGWFHGSNGLYLWDETGGHNPVTDPQWGHIPDTFLTSISDDGLTLAFQWGLGTSSWRGGQLLSGVYGEYLFNAPLSSDGHFLTGVGEYSGSLLRLEDDGTVLDLGAPDGTPPGGFGNDAVGISTDGRTIAGSCDSRGFFVWRDELGYAYPIPPGAGRAEAVALSDDGQRALISTDVGNFLMDVDRGGFTPIGSPEFTAFASDDLSVLANFQTFWTAATGEVHLTSYLADAGVVPAGYRMSAIGALSPDGNVFVGTGYAAGSHNPSIWMATIPTPGSGFLLAAASLVTLRRRCRIATAATVLCIGCTAANAQVTFRVVDLPERLADTGYWMSTSREGTHIAYSLERRFSGEPLGAFRWSESSGHQQLHHPEEFRLPEAAYSISDDGAAIAAQFNNSTGIWREGDAVGVELPGVFDNGAISANGVWIAGGDVYQTHLWRGTDAGGAEDLGDPNGVQNFAVEARGISTDGRTILGLADDGFLWREGIGYTNLTTVAGRPAWGNALSDDGQLALLGTLEGNLFLDINSGALTPISAAEDMVFANADLSVLASGQTFWTAATGEVDLSDLLASAGVIPDGYTVFGIRALSPDGNVFVGMGRAAGGNGDPSIWMATIPAPGSSVILGAAGLVSLRRRRRTAVGATVLAIACGGAQAQVSFTPLGVPVHPEFGELDYSRARGVSFDGQDVVGTGEVYSHGPQIAFRWNSANGISSIGPIPGHPNRFTNGTAISGDGQVFGVTLGTAGWGAHVWSARSGFTSLGTSPCGYIESVPRGINSDGSVVVGDFSFHGPAFRWTAAAGMHELGTLPGHTRSAATGVSYDGTTVVGVSSTLFLIQARGFRWTESAGMVELPPLTGATHSSAVSTSSDGSRALGLSGTNTLMSNVVLWEGTTPVDLGWDIQSSGSLVGASADLRVIATSRQFWTHASGPVNTHAFLLDNGVIPLGWESITTTAISGNGTTLVGYGRNPLGVIEAWRATIPAPGVAPLALGALLIGLRRGRGHGTSTIATEVER